MALKIVNAKLPIMIAVLATAVSGCAQTTLTMMRRDDPWQGWNRNIQSFNDNFDKHLLKPAAIGYLHITNNAIDQGVTNFFSNINDIGVSINDVLQFKLQQAGMDLGRFIVNTTVGVAGVFDWADPIGLPKHNEDFGQTLGVWGTPSGPYFVLPLFGPSTPRDTVGLIGDALLDPMTYLSIFGGLPGFVASAGASALDVTDYRAGLMTNEKVLNEATNNEERYTFIRDSYLQHRQYLLFDGNPPNEADPLEEDNGKNDNTPGKANN